MKIFPLFLLLCAVALTGCQQFPQLPAGVVGVNLTYTIAAEKPVEVVPEPRQPD